MFTPLTLLGLVAGILATSFLSGLFGMAGGMILMGLLLLMVPVPAAMVLHGVTQLASNGWRAWLWRRHIERHVALGYAGGALLALGLFTLVQLVPGEATVLIFLGLMPFANRLVPERYAVGVHRRGGSLACGFVCTALQLIAGVSGPVLDIFFVNAPLDRRQIVATKAVTQSLGHLLKLVYFGGLVAGADSFVEPHVYAVAILTALAGTTLSRRLLEGMSEGAFRAWSGRIIMAIGAVYLGQGLWLLLG
ncbi:MAG TPA: TSUP family transporter [Alphaproteobacteria bacterium]|nr:TSUP family transporter [Alphaproteobacteria bacterium]